MSDLQLLMTYMVVMAFAGGIFAYQSYVVLKAFFQQRRRLREYPSLEYATAENICQGPHKWDTIRLALGGLPADRYMVCTECGFVSTDLGPYKVNEPGLEVYRNELILRKKRDEQFKAKLQKKTEETNRLMNNLVKNNIESFDGDLQKNSYALQQFFRKSVMELDSLYDQLNKELDEEDRRG